MTDRMHELVFGKDHEVDADGKPIEKGIGSKHAFENHKPGQWPQDGSAHAAVFGHGAKVGEDGKPIETGIKRRNPIDETK